MKTILISKMAPTILILTVGTGTAGSQSNLSQGLANTIRLRPPSGFYLVPSTTPDSIAVAELILESLDPKLRELFIPWEDGNPFLMISEPDSLESSRRVIRDLIREARRRSPGCELVINPTSGTKQMSAAATLAALDEGAGQIVFTTGRRADGVVITGTEEITPFDSGRWNAEKEGSLAADLWDRHLHLAAAEVFRSAASPLADKDEFRQRLLGLALAADAFAHQEAFQFSPAVEKFKEARKHLRVDHLPKGSPGHGFGILCDHAKKRMVKLNEAQGGKRNTSLQRMLLSEIVDNSLRCAGAGRYEDAACRLYRAIEMELQIRLSEKTENAYWNGKLTKDATPPPALTTSSFLTTIRRSELPREFGMEHLARALNELGDESVATLCADLDLEKKSQFRAATATRNASILAHGVAPVDAKGFQSLKAAAQELLGLSTSVSNQIPKFDKKWLEVDNLPKHSAS